MAFYFDTNKVTNVLLFIIHCFGGSVNIQKLYLILYLSDVKHLSKYGSLITGDTYVAMKSGPIPFNILVLYRRLRERPLIVSVRGKQKTVLQINENQQATAHMPCDTSCLAESEVMCLFETVHEYKATPDDILFSKVKSKAWLEADISGDINLLHMAKENEATPEMIRYIEILYTDEINSFR